MRTDIFYLNCRGLRNKVKRKHVFNICHNHFISCLSKTFITSDISSVGKSEWGGSFFYYPGSINSQGLILLVNKKYVLDKEPIVILASERILAVKIFYEQLSLVIVNIYAPNKNKQKILFFQKLHNFLDSLETDSHIFVGGDFNTVLDNDLDIISGLPHGNSEIQLFTNLILNFDLIDTWRASNSNKKDLVQIFHSQKARLFTMHPKSLSSYY